jgi:putative oxidoreductase
MRAYRGVPLDVSRRLPLARWAPLPLRLIAGYGFMAHALAELSRGPNGFAVVLQGLSLPAPHLTAWVVSADGPQCGQPGYEVNLLYIACLLTLMMGGSGPLALDTLPDRRPSPRDGRPGA